MATRGFDVDERESPLRISIDHLLEGVQVIGRDWTYLYLNQTAARHGQRDVGDLVGRTMMACYPGIETTEVFARLQRVMEERTPDKLRNQFVFPNGDRRWFDLIVQPVPDGICVISLDVTDQIRLETELHHAQKMEAIGHLAGGVAHDFNNQLTVIVGIAELLLADLAPDSRAFADVQEIKHAGERSVALTRQLLAFSRRQVIAVKPTDLNDVVRGSARFLERLLGADIRMDLRLDAATGPILADAGRLENVLTNLLVNARDAMPNGGNLTIATADAVLTDDDARQHAMMSAGRYSVLSVTDSGHGMDDATKERIFEPFFTTKPSGKGTGLGLATVYGVVRQMGGFIWVYSEVGRGTTFRLYFPTTDERAATPDVVPKVIEGAADARILVVEDEPAVRGFAVRVLMKHGYAVVEAGSVEEAAAVVAAGPPITLALVDIVLRDGSASDVLPHLGPNCGVVYMSGYSDRHVREPGFTAGAALLEKPFTTASLLKSVREALRS